MVLERRASRSRARAPDPEPGAGEVLVDVEACGVCRTDLHVVDGELPEPKLPLVPGHQIVGSGRGVGRRASTASRSATGSAFPGSAGPAASAALPRRPREPLRRGALHRLHARRRLRRAAVADGASASRCPTATRRLEAAPLLCAGLIGYRALRMAATPSGSASTASAPPPTSSAQVARHQGRARFAFTRAGDEDGQAFARALGAAWAGGVRRARRPSRSTPRSSSRRSARWCPAALRARRARAGGRLRAAST